MNKLLNFIAVAFLALGLATTAIIWVPILWILDRRP